MKIFQSAFMTSRKCFVRTRNSIMIRMDWSAFVVNWKLSEDMYGTYWSNNFPFYSKFLFHFFLFPSMISRILINTSIILYLFLSLSICRFSYVEKRIYKHAFQYRKRNQMPSHCTQHERTLSACVCSKENIFLEGFKQGFYGKSEFDVQRHWETKG